MFLALHRWAEDWSDLAGLVLAIGYLGGFFAAMQVALGRLVFLASF